MLFFLPRLVSVDRRVYFYVCCHRLHADYCLHHHKQMDFLGQEASKGIFQQPTRIYFYDSCSAYLPLPTFLAGNIIDQAGRFMPKVCG
eukprot:m.95268 g.95268  ORF g.95268 m.95268 type:complete len:88 (-) comp14760_c0_seq4:581-844(-)